MAMTLEDYMVLRYLSAKTDGVAMSEVGMVLEALNAFSPRSWLQMPVIRAYSVLKKLGRQGLVEYLGDRNRQRYFLTEKGRTNLEALETIFGEFGNGYQPRNTPAN